MYKHQPSIMVAYLPDDRALATNASGDIYFVIEADGSFERLAVDRAVALFEQRLDEKAAAQAKRDQRHRKIRRILDADGGGIQQRRRRTNRERARRRRERQEAGHDQPSKHIRIADKARELEEKIRELEGQLSRKKPDDPGPEGDTP